MTTSRSRRSWASACVAMVVLSSGATLSARAAQTPAASIRVHGVYTNTQYGFRFEVLPGLAVFRLLAPAPNHGASIELGPARRIEISAAFDAPEFGSTEALLTARLPRSGGGSLHHSAATLGGRAAETSSYKDGNAFHLLVVRHEGGVDDGVNYTAELTTNAASQAQDRAMFDRLLATFRFVARTG